MTKPILEHDSTSSSGEDAAAAERADARHRLDTVPPSQRARKWLKAVGVWLPILVLLGWTFLPFLMTISTSLKSRAVVGVDVGLIPDVITFEGYRLTLAREGFQTALWNSFVIGVGTFFTTLLVAVPAAYAFARFHFRGRHFLLLFSLLPLLVPKVGLMLPLYRMAAWLGAVDSHIFLTFVFAGTLLPLATWLMVGFFQAIPRELEEAAAVDGASLWQRLRKIVLPLSLPALITIGILCFRESWTEFELVLALTTSGEKRTLPYELFLMQDMAGLPHPPAEAAFAILTVVPFILVYSRLERYVTQGFLSGAVK